MPEAAADYHETLRVPLSWWVVGVGLAGAVWWIFYVATPAWVAWVAGVWALGLCAVALSLYGAARVETGRNGLRAGRALLPWPHVGPSVALDRAETRRQIGPEADARAYLLLRGYCPTAVKVYVDDEADPTPYWIISTRRPGALAAHLNARIVQD